MYIYTMNLRYFAYLAFIFAQGLIYSQNLVWAKQYKGTNCCVVSQNKSLTVDRNENVYSTGTLYTPGSDPIDFDPGPGTFTLNAPQPAVFVTKLDKLGKFIWAKKFAGSTVWESTSIAVDDSSNVYVTGWFLGTVDFDPGPGVLNLTSAGAEDIFIFKLDSIGNLKWVKQIGGGSNDISYGIAVDKNCFVYTTGSFFSTCDFDPGVNTFTLAPFTAGCDIFVSKLNLNGDFVWAKKMGGSNNDRGYSIALDDSSNVYTTGVFLNLSDFDPSPGTYTLSSIGIVGDIFISKLDSSGNFRFAKQFEGSNCNELPHSIFVDKNRNIFTTGYFNGIADFDPGISTYNLTSSSTDVFISKLNHYGNFVWAKKIGGNNIDIGYKISTDTLGNIYTCGIFKDTTNFNPNPTTTFTMSSFGNYDLFVSKLDSTGNFLWAKQIGNSNDDYFGGMTVDGRQNIYLGSYLTHTLDLDPNIGTYTFTMTPNGSGDTYILKLGLCQAPINLTSNNNLSICSNSTILSASATGLINWYASPSSTVIIGTGPTFTTPILMPGLYNYYVEAVNSCTINPVRTNIQVISNTVPNVSVTTSNSLICSGQSATLTASGALTYIWNTGDTTAIISVTPTITTTYTVTGIDLNGCQNSYSFTQNYSPCLNNNEIENNPHLLIYPNPFIETLTVKIEKDSFSNFTFNIYNNLGLNVHGNRYCKNETKIDVSQLPSGIYYLEVILNEISYMKKIIKL